jgi:hypothetical protein
MRVSLAERTQPGSGCRDPRTNRHQVRAAADRPEAPDFGRTNPNPGSDCRGRPGASWWQNEPKPGFELLGPTGPRVVGRTNPNPGSGCRGRPGASWWQNEPKPPVAVPEAIAALEAAAAKHPGDRELLLAYGEQLTRLAPDDRELANFVEGLRGQIRKPVE